MLKLGSLLVFAGSLSMFLFACSEDEGEDSGISGGATNGSGATSSGGTINVPGGGTTGTGNPNNDGGVVPLTPDQITTIEMSACAGWTTEGENLPAVLFIVNDVSGSMESSAPSTGGQSKWEITHDALVSALDSLPGSTAVGIVSYPNLGDTTESDGNEPRDVSECVATNELVPIDLLGDAGSAQRNALQSHLDNADTGGGTPTHDAYRHGLVNGLLPYATSYNRFMLIITDGQPTFAQDCIGTGSVSQDPPTPVQPIIDEIAGAAAMGIQTFIIGSPGSEEGQDTGEDYRPWMSEAATVGGTAPAGCDLDGPNYCHMDMVDSPDFSAALIDGLAQIAGQINSCTYAVATPPPGEMIDMSQVNMMVTYGDGSSELILRDDNGDCTEGWQLQMGDQIVLCGDTCTRVQGDTGARVRLMFGCAPEDVPIPR